MHTHTYRHSIISQPEFMHHKFIETKLMQVIHVDGREQSCTLDGDGRFECVMDGKIVLLSIDKENIIYVWQISSVAIGDSWIGSHLSKLSLEFKESFPYDQFESKLNDYTCNFSCQINQDIASVAIYGIELDTDRMDEGTLVARVNASIDLLLVLTTSSNSKITFSGVGYKNTTRMVFYSQNSLPKFDEVISQKTNQWNEKLYVLRKEFT